MRKARWLFAAASLVVAALTLPAPAVGQPASKNKRLLLVTHSGGFIHDSVGVAEEVLKEVGPKYGYDVTCWRFTGDPDKMVKPRGKKGESAAEVPWLESYSNEFRARTGLTVGKENIGRVNKDTLKNFDVVLFFTTGSKRDGRAPLTDDELADLTAWVKAGGAFAGTHCATDTLYDSPYGDLIGAFFRTHPPGLQKIRVRVEDPKHPAAAGFTDGMEYTDEMYVFTDAPYSRDRLHIILSIDPATFSPGGGARKDADYAISWCREEGKGKVFYTSFGHDKKVWKDERFQKHLLGGLDWAVGRKPGDATPSGKKPAGG